MRAWGAGTHLVAGRACGQRALAPGAPAAAAAAAAAAQAALDLRELLAQHLLLVEAEGRVVGGHGEKQQELIARAALVELQPVVVDDGVDVRERAVEHARRLALLRAQQRQRHEQFAAHHLVCQVGEAAQVGRVVGLDLRVAQRVVVLAGQVLEARAEEAQLERDAQVQQAAQELHALRRRQLREPAVHAVPLQRAALLHHAAARAAPPRGAGGRRPGPRPGPGARAGAGGGAAGAGRGRGRPGAEGRAGAGGARRGRDPRQGPAGGRARGAGGARGGRGGRGRRSASGPPLTGGLLARARPRRRPVRGGGGGCSSSSSSSPGRRPPPSPPAPQGLSLRAAPRRSRPGHAAAPPRWADGRYPGRRPRRLGSGARSELGSGRRRDLRRHLPRPRAFASSAADGSGPSAAFAADGRRDEAQVGGEAASHDSQAAGPAPRADWLGLRLLGP